MRRLIFAALTALTLVGGLVAPAAAQAAGARVSATAEVVDPAVIDSPELLSAAGAGAQQLAPKPSSQVQPQVEVTVENGTRTLHIDYN